MELPTGFDAQDLGEVLDALPSLVAYVDGAAVLRYTNEASRTWLDRAPAEVVGRPVEELLDEAGCATTHDRLVAALGGRTQRFERALPDRGGRARHALVEMVPRTRGDHGDGCYVLVTDITRRVEAEAGHAASVVRSALLTERNVRAAGASDSAMQELFAIGLQLDRMVRHPETATAEAAPILEHLARTVDALRGSVRHLIVESQPGSTSGAVRYVVELWSGGPVRFDGPVDDLPPEVAHELLGALSEILAAAARHTPDGLSVHVRVQEDVLEAVVTVEGGRREDGPVGTDVEALGPRTLRPGATITVVADDAARTLITWRRPV
ncbi:PAS domain-containing protein [Nocardioides sp. T2.26MG-1]|uniref:PAS domain-containing protein n=1 Tax=Nocardioides sp. T2.26MG-1 TaxID=3041166 RepID=UPI0024773BD3|nr:PAS domain-containing protein [Nocardioides sp. T2.26MG-1]CAI9407703.1 hypothetical protein HIDPHFAB_04837 [Nocardioides sp. T2.26MG-1]